MRARYPWAGGADAPPLPARVRSLAVELRLEHEDAAVDARDGDLAVAEVAVVAPGAALEPGVVVLRVEVEVRDLLEVAARDRVLVEDPQARRVVGLEHVAVVDVEVVVRRGRVVRARPDRARVGEALDVHRVRRLLGLGRRAAELVELVVEHEPLAVRGQPALGGVGRGRVARARQHPRRFLVRHIDARDRVLVGREADLAVAEALVRPGVLLALGVVRVAVGREAARELRVRRVLDVDHLQAAVAGARADQVGIARTGPKMTASRAVDEGSMTDRSEDQRWPGLTSPDSYATTTSCARSRAPSLVNSRATWVLAVSGDSTSRSAISALDSP